LRALHQQAWARGAAQRAGCARALAALNSCLRRVGGNTYWAREIVPARVGEQQGPPLLCAREVRKGKRHQNDVAY
jgi:hypothetical protein